MPVGPTSVVRWLGGYDLAGPGALTEVQDSLEVQEDDATTLGPQGQVVNSAPIGRYTYTIQEMGHLSDTELNLRTLLSKEGQLVSILGQFGGGDVSEATPSATIASDLRVKSSTFPPNLTGFTKVSLEYFLAQGGEVFRSAQLLVGGARYSVLPVPGYNNYRADGGAASARGLVVAIMADGIVWDGATQLGLELVHSATDSATPGNWAALAGSRLNLEPPADNGQHYAKLTGNIRRYVAIRWTWTGGAAPSAKVIAAIKRL